MTLRAIISLASNVGSGSTYEGYDMNTFLEDFPDLPGLSDIPNSILEQFISLAVSSISPDIWGESTRLAIGLYVAHYLTCYLLSLKQAMNSNISNSDTNVIKRVTLGDTTVEYNAISSSMGQSDSPFDIYQKTPWGTQLVGLATGLGLGGMYIW